MLAALGPLPSPDKRLKRLTSHQAADDFEGFVIPSSLVLNSNPGKTTLLVTSARTRINLVFIRFHEDFCKSSEAEAGRIVQLSAPFCVQKPYLYLRGPQKCASQILETYLRRTPRLRKMTAQNFEKSREGHDFTYTWGSDTGELPKIRGT